MESLGKAPFDFDRHHEHLQKPYAPFYHRMCMKLTCGSFWCSSRQSLACVRPYALAGQDRSDFTIADDPNAAEVVKISEGQLFLVRSETVRGGRECMYVISS